MSEISAASASSGVPVVLLTAIALIETDRRPLPARLIENSLLRINALLHAVSPIALKDVTVGPFQIKLSTAARLTGFVVRFRHGWLVFPPGSGWLNLARIRELINFTTLVTDRASNAYVAAVYISQLHQTWSRERRPDSGYFSPDFIDYLGKSYNDGLTEAGPKGFIPYSEILSSVLHVIDRPLVTRAYSRSLLAKVGSKQGTKTV